MAAFFLLSLLVVLALVAFGALIIAGQKAAKKIEKPNDVEHQPPYRARPGSLR